MLRDGDWNIAMYPTNSPTPVYVFALAMSQEGSSTYSGASIAYNGSVVAPSNERSADSQALSSASRTITPSSRTPQSSPSI